jgi:calcineurin-like phosphoesterase family protein
MALLLADLHFGLKRKSGATQTSMAAYADFQFHTVESILAESADDHLLILGDIFSEAEVDNAVFLRTFELLSQWEGRLTLVMGNHDQVKDRSKLSSISLLARLLPNAELIENPTAFPDYWIIPHLKNQELFDQALAKAEGQVILTHANFSNPFAAESDHSLNITPEQAAKHPLIISGHEHNARQLGNVHMLGSPYPCSIAEVTDKFCHTWDGETAPVPFLTWSNEQYTEIDWRSLEPTDHQFIRVIGDAPADEAATVLQEFSKFRAASPAFFISNSVKIGNLEIGALDESSEELENFDPVAALKSVLSEKHRARLEEVMAA